MGEYFATVSDALRDLQCAMALLDAGMDAAQGVTSSKVHTCQVDGYALMDRASDLLDSAIESLKPIAAMA